MLTLTHDGSNQKERKKITCVFILLPSWTMQKVQSDQNDQNTLSNSNISEWKETQDTVHPGSDILTIVHAHFHMEGVTHYAPCEVTALPGPPCGLVANATLKYTPETYRRSLIVQFSEIPRLHRCWDRATSARQVRQSYFMRWVSMLSGWLSGRLG